MTRLMAAALAAVLTAGATQGEPPVQDRPPGRLLVDAVFLGKDGAPVTDLRRDEVEVWISGYRAPIERFIAITPETDERSGRVIVLVLDDVTMPLVLVERAKEAARRFVTRLSPLDRLSIVTLSGTTFEGTAGPAQLLRSIDSFNVTLTGVTPVDVLGARVLTTLTSIAHRLGAAADRRRTIVAIGSAWLFDTPLPPPGAGRDLRPEWIEAMRAMADVNANLYLIEPAGVGMAPAYAGSGGFTREAGGRAFVNTNDFDGAVDRIMREANSYYLLDVRDPPIQRKADLRELDVRVLRRGLTARARKAVPGGR